MGLPDGMRGAVVLHDMRVIGGHQLGTGRDLPLSIGLSSGNVNDSTMLGPALTGIRVPRLGPGRARTRPDRLLG